MNRNATRTALPLLGAFAVLLTACGPAAATEQAVTALPTTAPAPSPTSTVAPPTPSAELLPTAASLPEAALSADGPWLLIPAADGLWAVNSDGSGLTHLFDVLPLSPDPAGCPDCPSYRAFAAPAGGSVAIVEVDAAYPDYPPRLYLLTLPGGAPRVVTELIPMMDDWRYQTYYDDVWAAVGVRNQSAWSPDGRLFAFNGAMDGPSADLYIYDVERDMITRLTTGDTQSVDPTWSPDGLTIVHGAAESVNYGSSGGGDPTMAGVWTARPADGSVNLLFVSDVTAREEIVGWISDTTYLGDTCYHGYDEHCENLRTVDVVTGEVESVFPGSHLGGAYDPTTRTLLVSVPAVLYPPPDVEPGLYLLAAEGGEPVRIPAVEPQPDDRLLWSEEAGRFLLDAAEGLMAITTTGDVARIAPHVPFVWIGSSIDADFSGRSCAAVRDDGSLWVGTTGQELTRLWIGSVHDPLWSPDGQHLFFFDGSSDTSVLYVAQAPDFRPILMITTITESIAYNPPVWVWP